MTLTFWGAAQTVTGSLHFLELDDAGPGAVLLQELLAKRVRARREPGGQQQRREEEQAAHE